MTAAFLTAATLGFGRHGLPVTQDGQIISAVIVFFALGLWGFASTNLTRMWLHTQDQMPAEIVAIRQELQATTRQLKRLTDAVLMGEAGHAGVQTIEPIERKERMTTKSN